MSAIALQLVRAGTGESIDATLHVDLNAAALIGAEREWSPIRRAAFQRLLDAGYPHDQIPKHSHWNWEAKAQYLGFLSYRYFGLEADGKMQGLMLIDVATHTSRLAPDTGKPLVYVDYLESAP